MTLPEGPLYSPPQPMPNPTLNFAIFGWPENGAASLADPFEELPGKPGFGPLHQAYKLLPTNDSSYDCKEAPLVVHEGPGEGGDFVGKCLGQSKEILKATLRQADRLDLFHRQGPCRIPRMQLHYLLTYVQPFVIIGGRLMGIVGVLGSHSEAFACSCIILSAQWSHHGRPHRPPPRSWPGHRRMDTSVAGPAVPRSSRLEDWRSPMWY